MHDEPTTDDVGLEDRHGVQKSDEHLCMTDENGIPVSFFHILSIRDLISSHDSAQWLLNMIITSSYSYVTSYPPTCSLIRV